MWFLKLFNCTGLVFSTYTVTVFTHSLTKIHRSCYVTDVTVTELVTYPMHTDFSSHTCNLVLFRIRLNNMAKKVSEREEE